MRAFFFGVWTAGKAGHNLYHPNGTSVSGREKLLEFRWQILDGGLLPQDAECRQGMWYRAVIHHWTIISSWDFTGDKRPGSCACFVIEGECSVEFAAMMAERHFPELWKRINP